MTTATLDAPLTAQDRCDGCGAQAKLRATFHAGELLFCGHHGNEYLTYVLEAHDQVIEPWHCEPLHDEGATYCDWCLDC